MSNHIIVSNIKNHFNNYTELDKLHLKVFDLLQNKNIKYLVSVPNTMLYRFSSQNWNNVIVGAQNFDLNVLNTSQTGIDTLSQIIDAGAKFVILGHSEVRATGETNEYINQKVHSALANNLRIILCVGEKNRDRDYNNIDYIDFIKNQLQQNLKGVLPDKSKNIIIAYEPIWAIGLNNPASIDQILEINIVIRRLMNDMFGIESAKNIKILYGGSVDYDDARDVIDSAGSDGLLIGHHSFNGRDFANILNKIYA